MLFLLILLLSLLAQFFLPWWSIAVVCFGVAFLRAHRGGQAFLAGFGAIALSWLGAALFWHLVTDGLLSSRVAALLTIHSPWLLMAATVLIGGTVGGISALSGFFFRKALR
ncbi:hypothetical protein EFA69_04025 [Rufibacter immobilis]|uniref:Uncharacterized protein n=1 Tax=Rufibacter immobilis TaxID=1348778 RepID=A0A3M9N5B1_9BACT|nr:hypothetical protein [Rufibacter immobilis]RNI32497.1 hypothetical protein EFA69_04025 [Rufibacter immobilis]